MTESGNPSKEAETMKCVDEEVLSAYADGESTLRETARVWLHLPRCQRCRGSARFLSRIRREMEGETLRMPEALREELTRLVARDAHGPSDAAGRSGGALAWRPALGLAAACAVLAVASWRRSAAAEVPLELLLAAHHRYAASLATRSLSSVAVPGESFEPGLATRSLSSVAVPGGLSEPGPAPDGLRSGARGARTFEAPRSAGAARTPRRSGAEARRTRTPAAWEAELQASRGDGPAARLPSRLPEGYAFGGAVVIPSKRGGILQVRYSDGTRALSFFECPKGARLALGAEPDRTLKIGGGRARLLMKGPDAVLEWHREGRRYVLVGPLPVEALRAVAESVR